MGHQTGKVTALSGFKRGFHRPPQESNADATALIRKLGAGDVTARAEGVYGQLRTLLGYKRKELNYTDDAGTASIQTPNFAVHLMLDQDPGAMDRYRLSIEVSSFQRPEVMTEDGFGQIFSPLCDMIMVDFIAELDVEQAIFALEDWKELNGRVEDDARGSTMKLTLNEPPVIIDLDRRSLALRLARGRGLDRLVRFAQQSLDQLMPVIGQALR
jgi:hypothetical protein